MAMTVNPLSGVNAQILRNTNLSRQNVQFKGLNPKNVCNLAKRGLTDCMSHIFNNLFGFWITHPFLIGDYSLSGLVRSKVGIDIAETFLHILKHVPVIGESLRVVHPNPLTFKYCPTNPVAIVRSLGKQVAKLAKN